MGVFFILCFVTYNLSGILHTEFVLDISHQFDFVCSFLICIFQLSLETLHEIIRLDGNRNGNGA